MSIHILLKFFPTNSKLCLVEYSEQYYFQGHYVRVLGDIGDKGTETEVLLLECDVPHSPFSELVLRDLPQMPWKITSQVCKYLSLWYLANVVNSIDGTALCTRVIGITD